MGILSNLEPEAVFRYFEKICSIPHGSGNTNKISNFCVSFKVYLKMRMASILFYKDIGSTSFSNEHRFCRTFLRLLKTQMNYGGDTEKDYMRYT